MAFTDSRQTDMMRALKADVQGDVCFDDVSRALYSTDASIHEIRPVGIVMPRAADDVQAVVSFCARHRVPLLPRGGGTSLAGQAVGEAIHIDFSRYMHRVLEVNASERWVRVEPGVVLDDLNDTLAPYGLAFGPDVAPSNRATLGGMIGNNSCGTRSIVYGKTGDHVLEMRVLLADGTRVRMARSGAGRWDEVVGDRLGALQREVRQVVSEASDEIRARFPRIQRRVSGYNLDALLDGEGSLCDLVAGSEGTLAVIEEARLSLVPRPAHRGVFLAVFRDLDEALEANEVVLEHSPSAVELLDRMLLEMARDSLEYRKHLWFVEGEPSDMLLVELSGDSQDEVDVRMERLEGDLGKRRLGSSYRRVHGGTQREDVWKVRKAGLPLLMALPGKRKPIAFVEDAAVAPRHLAAFAARFRDLVAQHGTRAAFYAHASVGCLHIRPLLDLADPRDVAVMRPIAEGVLALVKEFGGAVSGEHGDGLSRSEFNEPFFGPVVYGAFRRVKQIFDPSGILNPGKVVDAPPFTAHLRQREGYDASRIRAHLDFSAEGGLAAAAERCNGTALCRKKTGTMCPSYMVTLDEQQSTRGRANAMRALFSGLLPAEAMQSPAMKKVFELCISCKSCQSECPSGVDVAKLKFEFLSHWYEHHAVPLRSRLFSEAALLGWVGCSTAPLSNTVLKLPPVRWLMDRFLGIDARRKLPEFTTRRFTRQVAEGCPDALIPADTFKEPGLLVQPGEKTTVLFPDTFTEYHHPEIGMAALRVLQATGRRVLVAPPTCCGRPMLSQGLFKPARENARILVEMLSLLVDQGCDIVGLEPSCVAAIRDDYRWFLTDEVLDPVARRTFTLEEYLLRLQAAEELPPGMFRGLEERVLLHVHCQQRALMGEAPLVRALRLVPGLDVRPLDAGCCGMAGAFGYEKEHYDISVAMGERKLLPAVRARGEGTRVVAAGTSCRQQIVDLAGTEALHPAQILAMALG